MRTKEEINKEIEAAQQFIKEYPYSIFGDDNKKRLNIFLKIIEKAQKGETSDMLYDFADDAYEDEDDHSHATATIEWLFEGESGPYSGE